MLGRCMSCEAYCLSKRRVREFYYVIAKSLVVVVNTDGWSRG